MLEQHVGVAARPGAVGAENFSDSVGVGSYRIDLHPSFQRLLTRLGVPLHWPEDIRTRPR